jgi:hypothetical protein
VKLAYVVPRYGAQVIGGAEYGARMLAERLARRPGWTVEVLTTCALDARTWADELPAGTTVEAGVPVHRFPVTGPGTPTSTACHRPCCTTRRGPPVGRSSAGSSGRGR